MDHGAHALHHLLGVASHIPAGPFQRHTHQCILVKIDNKLLICVLHGDIVAFTVRKILQDGVQQPIKVLLHLFPAHRAVNVEHKGLVILQLAQNVQIGFAPCTKTLAAFHRLGRIFHQDPVHQIVNILKVVVEGHAVHAAVLGDIVDRNFVQGLFQQQLLERCLQCPFCRL